MYNRQVYNPAAFGTGEATANGSLIYRMQWTMEGAPRFVSAWGDYRFTEKRMAAGVNINYNKMGISKEKQFLLNYSYFVPVTKRLKLSMGLRAGLASSTVDPNELNNVWDSEDGFIDGMSYSSTYAKMGAGFQIYSSAFYAGISAPDLYSGYKGFSVNQERSQLSRNHYISYIGGTVKLGDTYRLLPSAIWYLSPDANLGGKSRVDATILFEVNEYFYAGATATTKKQFTLMAGAYLSSRVRFGYAYEFQRPGEIARLNTHEVNLRVSIDNLFRN